MLMTCMAGAKRSIQCGIYINIQGFYHVIPNLVVRNEPNLESFQGKYRRSDAGNIDSVCLTVREKLTDRYGDNMIILCHSCMYVLYLLRVLSV